MSIYCTYVTFYRGNKLPPFYIGSSSVDKVNNGYHGSVLSKQYKQTWLSELKNNPHLFVTKILTTHDNRKDAISKEYRFQKRMNVVKSPMYINKAYANIDGMFGMDVNKENNPNYGNLWNKEQRLIASKRATAKHKSKAKMMHIHNVVTMENKMIEVHDFISYDATQWVKGRPGLNTTNLTKRNTLSNAIKCSCLVCKQLTQAIQLNNHYKHHHDTLLIC